jgi:hypothetical protein
MPRSRHRSSAGSFCLKSHSAAPAPARDCSPESLAAAAAAVSTNTTASDACSAATDPRHPQELAIPPRRSCQSHHLAYPFDTTADRRQAVPARTLQSRTGQALNPRLQSQHDAPPLPTRLRIKTLPMPPKNSPRPESTESGTEQYVTNCRYYWFIYVLLFNIQASFLPSLKRNKSLSLFQCGF